MAALVPGRDLHTLTLRTKSKSNRWEQHTHRWAHAVPLTDSADALKVNWCDVTVTDAAGKTIYHHAWIPDRELTADTVAGWVAAGRARWKIENENNNVLKTKGYHLEHNFGHGKEHLSSLLATMNLLAFALRTFLELAGADYQLIRATVGARRTFFEHLRALTTYLHFENWARLLDFMMRGLEIGPLGHAQPETTQHAVASARLFQDKGQCFYVRAHRLFRRKIKGMVDPGHARHAPAVLSLIAAVNRRRRWLTVGGECGAG